MQGNILKIRVIDQNGNFVPAKVLRASLIATLCQSPKEVDDGAEYVVLQSNNVTFDVRTENIQGESHEG